MCPRALLRVATCLSMLGGSKHLSAWWMCKLQANLLGNAEQSGTATQRLTGALTSNLPKNCTHGLFSPFSICLRPRRSGWRRGAPPHCHTFPLREGESPPSLLAKGHEAHIPFSYYRCISFSSAESSWSKKKGQEKRKSCPLSFRKKIRSQKTFFFYCQWVKKRCWIKRAEPIFYSDLTKLALIFLNESELTLF